MSASDQYRTNAADCLRLASLVESPDSKSTLVNMAQGWIRLAEQAQLNDVSSPREEAPGDCPSPQSN